MQIKRQDLFTTIRTEGAILPPDLLQRVASEDTQIGGLTARDYHLSGEKLNEAINRSWNKLTGAWTAFRSASEKLAQTDAGTSITRERWLLPLFQELGYGRLPTAKAVEVEGKTYSVSHRWQDTPIHLVGFRADLDRRTAGVAGAARTSPHSLLQEFLNRTDDLWGFVSNGLRLRVLRDNKSLTRQSFVEFELEAMMDGQVYPDFKLLWLICHQSRVEIPPDAQREDCWLEKWSQTAIKQGTRALDQLRRGVEQAITALGRGFLAHPANAALRQKLSTGTLAAQDYYRQLLRIIYRLMFLFVAEDRGLLFPPNSDTASRDTYTRFYSTQRLRALAGKMRGTPHADLYAGLRLIFSKLDRTGSPELALPALGSFLWSEAAIADLRDCEMSNRDLLTAINELAYTQDGSARRPVDYRNLGPEELGGIYESLLELHPRLNTGAGLFELSTAAGHERKTTSSYYTPTSLVNCLLDSALDPILDDAAKKPNPSHAILDVKVCDPACGSGHFLIAAAHRIAKRLAAAKTGDEEPAPEVYRHALRDVIGHCIYGVDMNSMAVELCKFSLWMEALEPGQPLNFLDHHIQCGNSLLGTTPALLEKGIPDEAFEAIEGDEKPVCKELRKDNRDDHRKQLRLVFSGEHPLDRLGNLPAAYAQLEDLPQTDIDAVHKVEELYDELVRGTAYRFGRLWADLWCAAFVIPKTIAHQRDGLVITESIFRRIEKRPHDIPPALEAEVQRLSSHYQFFHWHLAFPRVFRLPKDGESPENARTGWSGGFSLMLGNPPWDTLSPDQREFFGQFTPGLRSMSPTEQTAAIDALLASDNLKDLWKNHQRYLFALVHFFKKSGRFTLYAAGNLGKGDFNIYRMFVETALDTTAVNGFAAQIVPANLYGGANASAIRKYLFDHNRLSRLLGLENKNQAFFPGVHPQTWFCVYAAQRGGATDTVNVCFGIDDPRMLAALPSLMFPLRADEIRSRDPQTYAVPDLRSQADSDAIGAISAAWPSFGDASAGQPHRHCSAEIHMGSNRGLFTEEPSGLPVYEGRMLDRYDHRAKAYLSGRGNSAKWRELPFGSRDKAIVPQWRMLRQNIPGKLGDRPNRYRIGFGDVANPRNERSFVATLIPRATVCGHTVPTIVFEREYEWAYLTWLAVANSFVMDSLARRKLSSPHMTFTLLDSLPFPRLPLEDERVQYLAPRVLRLVCTAPEMTDYWNAMSAYGWCSPVASGETPPGYVTPEQRDQALAEVDAFVAAKMFGVSAQQLGEILDSFLVLAKREKELHGTFRTKDLILNAYGAVDHAKIVQAKPATLAPAEETEQTFPANPRDKQLCAVFLDLVKAMPGASLGACLDGMILAARPDLCEKALFDNDRKRYQQLVKQQRLELFDPAASSLPWADIRQALVGIKAVAIDKQANTVSVGVQWKQARDSLGALPDQLVSFIAKATKNITDNASELTSAGTDVTALKQSIQKERTTMAA